ncbi:MAG: cobaltochelatase subunit CobN, partial [Pseudomonadota bacterium]
MHLLAATPGTVSDGTEPVDPGQTPADILFLSAADTELALLSEARAQMDAAPSLRLTQLSWLAHPFSVDLYLTTTAERSRLVIARVLGGQAYWTYGVEQFAARLRAAGVPLVLLPGDDKPDAELAGLSTVSAQDYAALWAYCVEGGVENAGNLLRYAKAMLDGGAKPEPARPLLRAGLYWPGAGTADLDLVRATWQPDRPTAALVFYRALVQGAGLHPVNRLVKALLSEGVNPLPIFVASLKDPVSAATLAALFEQAPPSVVLNATGFAVSSPAPHAWDGPRAATPLDAPGAPVLQVVFSGSSAEAWETSAQGLGARDIAMNVALPEVDGRVLSRAVSFKGEAYRDDATECAIPTYRAQGDRVTFVAKLAAKWAALAQVPVGDKRVALILANYPNKDGRLANGVGLDTPASAVHVLGLLARNGYGVTDAPRDSADLMARVQAGPTNWLPDRATRTGGARLSLEAYMRHYSALPWEVRDSIEGRWGPPQDDPFLAEDGFALSVLSFGNVVVGLQPARGYEIDPEETYHSPDLVPPHHYLAFYLWLRDAFGAQAIVHLGKHGNLEWLPGKAVGLSQTCWPELALGHRPQG